MLVVIGPAKAKAAKKPEKDEQQQAEGESVAEV
jgi:hypothetical protein